MLRRKVIDTLKTSPLTLAELSGRLGVPQPMLRTALTGELFRQVEVDHPEHGRVTAWTLRPSAITVDGHGRYAVLAGEGPA